MKDEFVKNIGAWGQLHYAYLKKTQPDNNQCYADERNA